jgi:hypothetical protein
MSRRRVACCLAVAWTFAGCVTATVPEPEGHERAIAEAEENGFSTVPTTSSEPRVAFGQSSAAARVARSSEPAPDPVVGQATGREGPAREITIEGSYFTSEPRPAQAGALR